MTAMFRRVGEKIRAELSAEDRALLTEIPELLNDIGAKENDPAAAVLDRPAYRGDRDASAEFRELMESQIKRERFEDRSRFASLLAVPEPMTDDEARGVLRVLNEARLALAARSGAMDGGPGWELRISADKRLAVVAWLGFVESQLLAAMVPPDR
ncbi:MAG: DUF2017 family protein [Acidimicrobiia bacterium]